MLDIQTLPTRREEAWKWTDVRGRVSDDIAGLSVAGLPKFTLPDGITVSEVETDDLDTDTAMAKLARNFGGKVWHIAVPEGFNSDTPLIIEGLNRGHIRIRIDIAKGASLNVIEHHAGDVGGFVNIDMTVTLKSEAKFDRTIVHNDPADCVRIATAHITAWNDAD